MCNAEATERGNVFVCERHSVCNRRRNSDSSDTEEVGVMVARNRDGTIDMSIVKEYVGKHRRDTKAGKTVHADSQQDDDTKAGETFHADSQQQE